MKKLFLSLIMLGLFSSYNVAYTQPVLFTCEAYSSYAYGVGVSYIRNIAARRALYECQIRTPYGEFCYLTNCSPY